VRRKTREVLVGSVGVGGKNPIRIQSMTTTPTMDTKSTVEQVKRLVQVGCEIVRITAPTVRDAKNLETIKNELLKAHCPVPLVADIHFSPEAAIEAANYVEKVRINPGNFTDGKAFRVREYTDEQYNGELKRIEERFLPLLLKLKNLRRSLRIGTNHGSLSDRILNRYGDTPLGMVESALEFARICRKYDFHDVIFSMKASNPKVMIAAYRLLATRLDDEGMDYPFHLGVTEAGDGEDGRIKSAVGIGSLLEDGIGDTIRVSLTEDPECEIPVAREIADRYSDENVIARNKVTKQSYEIATARQGGPRHDSNAFTRRESRGIQIGSLSVGGNAPIRIWSKVALEKDSSLKLLALLEERLKNETPPELIEVSYHKPTFSQLYEDFYVSLKNETDRLALLISFQQGQVPASLEFHCDGFVYHIDSFLKEELDRLVEHSKKQKVPLVLLSEDIMALAEALSHVPLGHSLLVGLKMDQAGSVHAVRQFLVKRESRADTLPLVLYSTDEEPNLNTALVQGSLICDGFGDVVCVGKANMSSSHIQFAYNLLQACGSRITKTEFVSCPSCGRTLFDLQSTAERIKSKTGHLKGVKIAIMGCIVNGPGEMADADFGYVGGGPGKINLYVGKECVEKSIPTEMADEKLVELIMKSGKWVDPT